VRRLENALRHIDQPKQPLVRSTFDSCCADVIERHTA